MYQAARGTADILPEEQPYWRYVEKAIAEITALYGYQRIDTPMFEDTGLFRRSAGECTDIVQKEMYTFDDRGGNSLTLKPEGTPAVCRAYIQHGMQNLPQPVKLYYISPIFRYDRPQAGRYRQHYQFGCEAIGEGDPAIDAEVIDMAWRFYRSLGLANISLQLNSIGCKVCRPQYLDALKSYYQTVSRPSCAPTAKQDWIKTRCACSTANRRPAGTLRRTPPAASTIFAPTAPPILRNCRTYLGLLGIPFSINHRLVRGLDYYTRTVFEIQPEDEGGQSAIGGGGRYDGLIEELGGKPTPALGFAAGIERIILNLKKQGISVPTPTPIAGFYRLPGRAGPGRGAKAYRRAAARGNQRGDGHGR